MCITRVLVIMALCMGLAYSHSFPWEIVEGRHKQLNFYNNRIIVYSKNYPSVAEIKAVTYDPVHNRVLFADEKSDSMVIISSFDIATGKTQTLIREKGPIFGLSYDPATESVFWVDVYNINSFSLKPGSNQAVDVRIIAVGGLSTYNIAVDSCGGYVYWTRGKKIERVRLDGSEREVLLENTVDLGLSLAIDHQTQKMYWSEPNATRFLIKSADLNGKNTLLIGDEILYIKALTVSNDFIYWRENEEIWQLPKNPANAVNVVPKIYLNSSIQCGYCQNIAAKYIINEEIWGIDNCEALKGPTGEGYNVSICQNYCFQGECNVSAEGKPKCRCNAGYSGARCEDNACHNFCLQGNCSVSTEGQPKCRCNAGYSGERCEFNACHDYCLQGNCTVGAEGQPECRCNAGYSGERCEFDACHEYCLQGNCSVGAEGQPECRCNAGYSGERCEFDACHEYCLQGNCSVGAEGQPECRCNAGYSGEKCEIDACHDYCLQGKCSISAEGQPECSCNAGYLGERCEVNACRDYCLNDGVCSLNEEDEPACQCTAQYAGERCDVLSETRNEAAGQSCSHSQPDSRSINGDDENKVTQWIRKEGECCDSDFQAKLISMLQTSLKPMPDDDISTMKVQINNIINTTTTLLAEHKMMKEKISQLQQNCANNESKTSMLEI